MSVVSSSQPEQNNLLCPVQFVEAVWLVVVWVLLLPFFLGEGFDDFFLIGVRGVAVLLFQLASLPGKPACPFISQQQERQQQITTSNKGERERKNERRKTEKKQKNI